MTLESQPAEPHLMEPQTIELQIIDLADSGQVQLSLVNAGSQQASATIPFSLPANRINQDELLWYFQARFGDASQDTASRTQSVETGLRNLGRGLYQTLFENSEEATGLFERAKLHGLGQCGLVIISHRGEFLNLPWESVNEQSQGYLAAQFHAVVRRLSPDPLPDVQGAPGDQQFNVLLVSPMPKEAGVSAGNLAAETLNVLESVDVQVELDVLRPPTFTALSAFLDQNPGRYHLVHLDGILPAEDSGSLLFDEAGGTPDGSINPVPAAKVAEALSKAAVPVVLLNAGSVKSVESSNSWENASRTLAETGVPLVVSVPFPLSGPARKHFTQGFYQGFIQGASIPAAVAQARRGLMDNPHRPGAWGALVHWDWLLPVVYQSAQFLPTAIAKQPPPQPQAAGDTEPETPDLPQGGPYGLVGRRQELGLLERMLQQNPVVLLTGDTGVGKTELALGLANWTQKTGAGEKTGGVFYTTFEVGAGLERVVHEIGTTVAGLDFADLPAPRQIRWVADYLKEHPALLVWDSVERVAGFPPGESLGLLEPQEHAELNTFIEEVCSTGGTSALLVSRSNNHPWMTVSHQVLKLEGFTGDDRLELGGLILNRGAQAATDAPQTPESHLGADYLGLMELVEGHPLAMQIALPILKEIPASVVVGELENRMTGLQTDTNEGDTEAGRPDFLTAAMDYSFSRMSRRVRTHLPFLSLFQRRVMLDILTHITQEAPYRNVMGEELGWGACRTLLRSARDAGFMEAVTPSVYQINPAFPWFYGRSLHRQARAAGVGQLEQEFVRVYADTADYFLETLYENQGSGATAVLAEEGNLTQALALALESRQWEQAQILVQPLAQVYRMQKRYPELRRLRRQILQIVAPGQGTAQEAQAQGGTELWLYLMGTEASEATDLGDLPRSEEINRQLLEYLESQDQGDKDPRTASVYHQFGVIALQRWQLEQSEEWFQKSLAIIEAGEDREPVADDYYCLGQIRQHQRRYTDAKEWFSKSLEIHQRSQDPEEMVKDYRALGQAAQYKFEHEEAESWYQRARSILEENRDEETALLVYHELGTVYHARYMYEEAERWYKQSLTLSDRLGKGEQMALEFHYLGLMEQSRGMFYNDAENWLELAREKREELGDRKGVGDEYRQLGVLHHEQKKLDQAEQCYRQALDIFEDIDDLQRVSRTLGQLAMVEEDRGNLAEALSWAHRTYQLAIEHQLPALTQVKAHLARLREKFGETEFNQWWRGSTGGEPPTDLDPDTGAIL